MNGTPLIETGTMFRDGNTQFHSKCVSFEKKDISSQRFLYIEDKGIYTLKLDITKNDDTHILIDSKEI